MVLLAAFLALSVWFRTRELISPRDAPRATACAPVGVKDESSLPAYLRSNLNRDFRDARFDAAAAAALPRRSDFFHARIRNNSLTIVHDAGGFQSRNANVQAMLRDALAAHEVPDCEFVVCTGDRPRATAEELAGLPLLVAAKLPGQPYLTYPDFSFNTWAEASTGPWDAERGALAAARAARKTPRAMFRGNLRTNPLRSALFRASRSTPELDIKHVEVGGPIRRAFVPLRDHARWKYLLHLPGGTYSARLKYLLATDSVVLRVAQNASRPAWREFWYGYLDEPGRVVDVSGARPADVVKGVVAAVRAYERDADAYAAVVAANERWRESFDYDLVLRYWAVLLRRYARAARCAARGG